MPRPHLFALLVLLAFDVACVSLNYPEPEPDPGAEPGSDTMADARSTRSAPSRTANADSSEAGAMSWSDLTKAAREHARLRQFDEAQERLEQAELLVQDLPPTSARRRTVFNMEARLARRLAAVGEIERADALASRLFEEAEREPELGDDALVSLALSVAERRSAAEAETGDTTSQLALYRIAFETARRQTTSRDRIAVARSVAMAAFREGDLPLARAAIDLSIADARRLIATPRGQTAQLEVVRARIAMQQGDLDAAEDAAKTADQILAARGADASQRAVAEELLAEIAERRSGGGIQSPDGPMTPTPSESEAPSDPPAPSEPEAPWGAEPE